MTGKQKQCFPLATLEANGHSLITPPTIKTNSVINLKTFKFLCLHANVYSHKYLAVRLKTVFTMSANPEDDDSVLAVKEENEKREMSDIKSEQNLK